VQLAAHVAPIGRLLQLAGQPVVLEGAVALGAPEQVLTAHRQACNRQIKMVNRRRILAYRRVGVVEGE
jgi:hypothetical protein